VTINYFSLSFEDIEELYMHWIEFILRFLYRPESIGVTEFASNSCSSSAAGGFNRGSNWCFNGAGSIMKGAWERFFIRSQQY